MVDTPLPLTSLNRNLNDVVRAINALTQQIAASFPQWVAAPATAASSGTAGQVAYDATHFYVCVASNTWVRVALATF